MNPSSRPPQTGSAPAALSVGITLGAIGLLVTPLLVLVASAASDAESTPEAVLQRVSEALEVYDNPGFGDGQLHQPRALAFSMGRLFVADRTGRILRFRCDPERGQLTYERSWTMPMVKNGFPAALAWHEGLACLLVGETHYGRVSRYCADGEPLGSFGRVGSLPGEFQRIQGIDTNARGDIFVTDTYDHSERVQVFDQDGVWLRQWGGEGDGPGAFNRPTGIAVSPDGRVYVADAVNHRIQVFTEQGVLLETLAPPGLRYPYDLALDATGSLYCIEFTGSRVLRWGPDRSIVSFGGPGGGPGQFAQPWGLTVLPDGLVFVADTRNHRIVSFRMQDDGPLPLDRWGAASYAVRTAGSEEGGR